jgi:uncharacterized membrane protein HdeD (DUF308 family)
MAEGKKKTLIIIGIVLILIGLSGLGIGVYNNFSANPDVAMAATNVPVDKPSPFPQIIGALSLIAGVITLAAGSKKDE